MKILSITAQKPHSTGSGIYLTELVRSFGRMGHQQAVVAGIYPEDSVGFPNTVKFYPVYFNNKEATPMGDLQDRSGYVPFPIAGMSDEMPYVSTKYRDMTEPMVAQYGQAFIETIAKAIGSLEPDVIICHHLFLLTAMVRKNFPNQKIYGICHGSDLRQMASCVHLQDYVRSEIANLDRIFVLHDEQVSDVIKLYGSATADKIEVIGSGYNESVFNTDGRVDYREGEPVRLYYAGKMSAAKGVPELLDSLDELAAMSYTGRLPAFTFTMAGGCQDITLKERLAHLPSCVKYIGQVPQSELAEMFKKGDVFVLPSYYEGLSLVLIEAMACGMVPISTDLPGTKDWIDSNVERPNIRYISRPEMAGIDTPTEAGREKFTADLSEILAQAIKDVAEGADELAVLPITSGITWTGVAMKILGS